MSSLPTINGTPPGTGVVCKHCGKDQREFCWLLRMCDLELETIGPPAVKSKEKKRGKRPKRD